MHTRTKLGFAATLLVLPALFAADWPQWNGPDRTGVSPEKGLLKEWPKDGPKLLWTFKDAGTGFTAPAVIGDTVYTMGARKDTEYLIALDGKGKELWAVKIGPKMDYKGNEWSGGPNSTPTVDKDLIFALGSGGDLVCITADGKTEKWRKNMPKDFGGEVNPKFANNPVPTMAWGYCWSPLADGDNLILTPGGRKGLFVALKKTSGELVWQSKDLPEQCTYASPIAADVKGVRQYIAVLQDGCAGVDAKSGNLLWRYKRKQAFGDIVAATPVYHDGHVFITGVGGCDLVKIDSDGKTFTATAASTSTKMQNMHGGVVLVDKTLYGADQGRSWKAFDFKDVKKEVWDSGRDGITGGSLIATDGMLYLLSEEENEVALIEASPKGYTEKGTFKLPETSKLRKPSGKFWTHPVVANGRLYLRDQELIFCYDVKGK
jgi:outer membrane protein assembly factor BamB